MDLPMGTVIMKVAATIMAQTMAHTMGHTMAHTMGHTMGPTMALIIGLNRSFPFPKENVLNDHPF